MRARTAPIAVVALGAVLASPVASRAAQITVWADYDMRGSSTVFTGPVARFDSGWNDRISSFRVDSGTWEICRDWDYRNCRIVGPGTEEARIQSGWNDVVTSLRPVDGATTPGDVEATTQRLYRALLGRDADPEGLRNASAQVRAGRTADLINGITSSQEYRSASARLSPTELLDQIYRGLLGRDADTAARTAFSSRLQRGDVSGVVLDIMSSDEFRAGSGTTTPPVAEIKWGDEVRTRGKGYVIWGGKKYFDTANAARVKLADSGRIQVTLTGGHATQWFEGTYVRESPDYVRVETLDWPDRGTLQVRGGVRFDRGQVARVDVSNGTEASRDRVLFNFVADGYQAPRDESMCQDEIRSRLQSQGNMGDQFAFLAPTRSRTSNNGYRLTGEVLLLTQNASAQYTCDLDARGSQLLDASVVSSR